MSREREWRKDKKEGQKKRQHKEGLDIDHIVRNEQTNKTPRGLLRGGPRSREAYRWWFFLILQSTIVPLALRLEVVRVGR